VVVPLAIPGLVAGSIFTFSLTLGDYINHRHRGAARPDRQRHREQRRRGQQHPVRRGVRDDPDRHHGRVPALAKRTGAFEAV
jgi:hypothetical protein